MTFSVTGKLAMNSPEAAQRGVILPVKIIIGSQRVNTVLGVTGVINEIICLMPLASIGAKHHCVSRCHDLRKGCWPTPVTSRTTDHGMDIHQGHRRARGVGVRDRDGFAGGVVYAHGIFGPIGRGIRQTGWNGDWFQGWHLDGVHG